MSFVLPVFRPARCAPARVVRNDLAPLFSLLDDSFSQAARTSRHSRRAPFAPRFNVSEGSDHYVLEGELPGVDQKDVSVEFTAENTLTVRGRVERRQQSGQASASGVADTHKQVSGEETIAGPIDTESVQSHQPTVEDEKEWTEVDTPATSEAGPSTVTAQNEEASASPAPVEQQQPHQQQQQPESRSWLSERFTGDFSRSFSFSERVDQEAVRASLSNGILSIVVPKAAKPENRKITVE